METIISSICGVRTPPACGQRGVSRRLGRAPAGQAALTHLQHFSRHALHLALRRPHGVRQAGQRGDVAGRRVALAVGAELVTGGGTPTNEGVPWLDRGRPCPPKAG